MRIPHATDVELTGREKRHVILRTWQMLKPYRGLTVLAVFLVLAQTALVLGGPMTVRYGIDSGVRAGNTGVIARAALIFICLAFGAYVVGRATILVVTRVGESFLRDLRGRAFDHIMSLGLEFFDRTRTGVLVSRMTADVESLQELVGQGLTQFVVNILLFVGAAAITLTMSWQLAVAILVVVPMVALAARWFRRASQRAYLTLRDKIGLTLTSLQEGLSGVRVVQAFNQEDAFVDRFADVNEQQFEAHMRAQLVPAIFFPVIELAQGFAIAIILGFGGVLVVRDVVTIGTVAAFALYLQNLFEPVQQLSQFFNTLQAAAAGLSKLFGVLDEKPAVGERPGAVDLEGAGRVSLERVSFAYGARGDTVLSDVSLVVEPGKRLAVVGPTGAGKSTLAKLVVRFYDPTDGVVRIDGLDLRDATLSSLRDRVVVVPQEGFLFGGTVRDNVIVGRGSASAPEVDAALAMLGLTERFAAFPDGLDTEVHERGANFSAGERQLVSLARAALADPAILVLDEATSNLDPGTELLVQGALERLMQGRTVIVVAHRLSTAARADRVVMVDGGRIVDEGTHDELLAREGPYAALFASWAGASLDATPAAG